MHMATCACACAPARVMQRAQCCICWCPRQVPGGSWHQMVIGAFTGTKYQRGTGTFLSGSGKVRYCPHHVGCMVRAGYWGMDCSLSMSPAGKVEVLAGKGYTVRKRRPWVYVYDLPHRLTSWYVTLHLPLPYFIAPKLRQLVTALALTVHSTVPVKQHQLKCRKQHRPSTKFLILSLRPAPDTQLAYSTQVPTPGMTCWPATQFCNSHRLDTRIS